MIPEYRAWEKKNQRWMTKEIEDSEESEIRLDLWGNVTFRLPWWEQVTDGIYTVDGSEMFDITQSTGLKDKNGVEIYEGDVLRDSESIVIVKFVDGEFSVDYRTTGGKWRNYGSLFDYLEDYEGEIIGNIYENPELMEVAE